MTTPKAPKKQPEETQTLPNAVVANSGEPSTEVREKTVTENPLSGTTYEDF